MLVLDADIFIFDFLVLFSENGTVSGTMMNFMAGLLTVILSGAVVFFVVFQFDKIKGVFAWIYLPSLFASFLMPLFFGSLNTAGFISFPWIFMGGVLVVLNTLFGPAMLFFLSYSISKKLKSD